MKLNENMKKIKFKLVWFDSFGAKSSCTLVETPDLKILIDPGIAIMHPSFPASHTKKLYWVARGRSRIIRESKSADCLVISHYHWDHFLPRELKIYEGKILFAKNPNEYINDSQRRRALDFYSRIWNKFGGGIRFQRPVKKEFEDPALKLKSVSKDFGDYQPRRIEVLRKGREWFERRARRWRDFKVIPEAKLDNCQIVYPEGREFRFGKTKLRFTHPLFHGIEYSRVGWVFSTIIEYGSEKLIHSSDLNGPIIEDYADWLIKENPTYLLLDGPMTYMLGYTLNLINFRRVLENAKRIVKKVDFRVMIWDHHLPREPRFRERTEDVWRLARELGKELYTASEFELGRKPVVECTLHKKDG